MKRNMIFMFVFLFILQANWNVSVGAKDERLDSQNNPSLLVTELVPSTSNVNSANAYEYIEIYNNTIQPIELHSFKLMYVYPDGREVEWGFVENKQIPAQKSIVAWIKNDGNQHLTFADFNSFYDSQLTEEQLVLINSDGMANTAARGFYLKDINNEIISSASYDESHVIRDKGIHYSLSMDQKTMEVLAYDQTPTPGMIQEGQAPIEPVQITPDFILPTIIHEAIASIKSKEDIVIEAEVTDETNVGNVTLQYRLNENDTWEDIHMERKDRSDIYTATILQQELVSEELFYRIVAFDGFNYRETDIFQIAIEVDLEETESELPLLITELLPDSLNVGGLDGYEFIEIYNNTSSDLNLKDYTIRYRYPMDGPEADLIWPFEKRDIIVQPGRTLVAWIINTENTHLTENDFNEKFGTNLVLNENLVKIYSGGMANSGERAVVIATNTGQDVAVAHYNDEGTKDDTVADMGIQYMFPTLPNEVKMLKYSSASEKATPGEVTKRQVPMNSVQVTTDSEEPTINDLTDKTSKADTTDLSLLFDIQDNQSVKTVRLFYRNNEEVDFHEVDLIENDDLYYYTIYSPNFLGKISVEYYLSVSDGTHTVQTESVTVPISQGDILSGLYLNVEDSSVLSKSVVLKAAHDKNYENTTLLINSKDVTSETFLSLAEPAYFVFDVKKVNLYFKNGVTIGDEILHIFDDTINTYVTKTIPIDPSYFTKGKDLTISIRAGTKVSPFDFESEENRDDFYAKNIRLVLRDGTVLYDSKYADPTQELTIGDGGTATPVYDFTFTVPENKFIAKSFEWDTTKEVEEQHTITVQNGTDRKDVKVRVDNSAPVLTVSVENGKEYKGDFTIDAEAVDAVSGVVELKALLNQKEISLPMHTSSAQLSPGKHVLEVIAIDQVGNEVKESIEFTVAEEIPNKPEVVAPKDEATDVSRSPKLSVKVSDPTQDSLDVSFMKGFRYDVLDTDHIKIYENSSDIEPPKEIKINGEKIVEEASSLAKVDNKYITTKSIDKFPYHRFEITLDEEVGQNDEIEINWEGKSIIGRKVTMYIWNYDLNKWEAKEWKVAENNQNFTLQALVKGSSYVKDRKAQVMVQDEIASTNNFDYSFIWMSDTQYYAESYPHIFKGITDWIVNNQEEYKIKYVFHTGDLVDEVDDHTQWDYANEYMRTLDLANLPYGVLAGNHDVGHKTNDYTQYSHYFGVNRFSNKDYYGESYKDNRGHYDLISVNGNDFIMLYMGWGVNDEDLNWLNAVLEKYPDRKAILSFHEYLLVSGNRSPIGDEIYNKVVLPNKNVIAVLSGHYHDSETLIDEIDDNQDGAIDRKVYQMLADYQGGPEGGQGFIRIMQVNPVENKIYMKTYSPYLNQFNYYDSVQYPGKDEFVMDVDLTPMEKEVSTDFFEVNVYSEQKIGEVKGVIDFAEMTWANLAAKQEYEWYTIAKDGYNGQTRSDIWSFYTSNENSSNSGGSSGGNTSLPKPEPETPNKPDVSKPIEGEVIEITKEQLQVVGQDVKIELADVGFDQLTLSLEKNLLDSIISNGKSLKFEMKDGIAFTLNKENMELLLQMQGNHVFIQVKLETASDREQLLHDWKTRIVDIQIAVDAQEVTEWPSEIEIYFSMNEDLDEDLITGAYYNEATGRWEYAKSYESNKQWIIPTNHLSKFAILSNLVSFLDVSNHWARKEIQSVASRLITNGTTKTTFSPNKPLTRAEFTVMLSRIFQIPTSEYSGIFNDVPSNMKWAATYIEATAQAGIVYGTGEKQFNPNVNITREQMTVMIIRALRQETPTIFETLTHKQTFIDDPSIAHYAKQAVKEASELGIVMGDTNGRFNPKQQATRAEMAVILYRLLNIVNERER